jgi:hypothetical protein
VAKPVILAVDDDQIARSQAVELIHRLADRIGDSLWRASFLTRPDVREALA